MNTIQQNTGFQNQTPQLSTISSGIRAPQKLIINELNNGKEAAVSPPVMQISMKPQQETTCELLVLHIPKDLNKQKLIQPFIRFGRIYEIRLPMDLNQANRGYAFVKYTNEDDAACAKEVLSHYFITHGCKLEILHSYEKCRLFVSNIPKHLSEAEIEDKLRAVFPTMQRIFTRGYSGSTTMQQSINASSNFGDGKGDQAVTYDYGVHSPQNVSPPANTGNRGHVFIDFPSHIDALEAKKSNTPDFIRMWDRDLEVVWANAEPDVDTLKATRTLFVRNVDLSVNNRVIIDMLIQYVSRKSIGKISKVRTTASFDFKTREAAEICLKQMQGIKLRGQRLDIEWSKPSEQILRQSLHRLLNIDFDAVLRLKCIANGWQIPIVLFGTYYETEGLQYGAVVLRDASGFTCAVFLIMNYNELFDIHSRMCETVCELIETVGTFPDNNYVFQVQKDSAHMVGIVFCNVQQVEFVASRGVPKEFYFDLNEIIDLSLAVALLSSKTEEVLLNAYHKSFCTTTANTVSTYLQWLVLNHRLFGTIMPKYRNKPPLKHDLNDTQIVLALCYVSTGSNCALPTRPYVPSALSTFGGVYEGLPYVSLKLLPFALMQSGFTETYLLSHVLYGGIQYYHPEQRIMTPPIWITGCSYAKSIKQPTQQTQEQQHQRLRSLQLLIQHQRCY